mgnify:CR=1 FL=1
MIEPYCKSAQSKEACDRSILWKAKKTITDALSDFFLSFFFKIYAKFKSHFYI